MQLSGVVAVVIFLLASLILLFLVSILFISMRSFDMDSQESAPAAVSLDNISTLERGAVVESEGIAEVAEAGPACSCFADCLQPRLPPPEDAYVRHLKAQRKELHNLRKAFDNRWHSHASVEEMARVGAASDVQADVPTPSSTGVPQYLVDAMIACHERAAVTRWQAHLAIRRKRAWHANQKPPERLGWPAFPLRTDEPGARLAEPAPGVAVIARFFDGSGSTDDVRCDATERMRAYMRRVGCVVPPVDRSARQYATACGVVAARALVDMMAAADWRTVDLGRAVEDRWLDLANRECSLFSNAVLEGSAPIPNGSIQLPGRPPSRFLTGCELENVVECFYAHLWPVEVRTYGVADGRARSSWFDGAVTTDGFVASLAQDVSLVHCRGGKQLRFFALHDADGCGRGTHWVAVVYEVCPTGASSTAQHSAV